MVSRPRRLGSSVLGTLGVLVPLWAAGAPTAARAQDAAAGDAGERIDDPKLARRLGTRIDLGPTSAASPDGSGVATTVTEAAPPPEVAPSAPRQPLTPRLKVGYRRFSFAQVGAPGTSGPGASEPFDVVSIDLYPVSSEWRFGLTGQYGWQEGTFRDDGDAFFAGALSLGGQIPGPVATPFIEAFAGGGLMQRTKSDLGLDTIATLYGQLGVDAGTEVFLAPHFCLSFALGWIHLADVFARKAVGSFSTDTWSFKLGVGL